MADEAVTHRCTTMLDVNPRHYQGSSVKAGKIQRVVQELNISLVRRVASHTQITRSPTSCAETSDCRILGRRQGYRCTLQNREGLADPFLTTMHCWWWEMQHKPIAKTDKLDAAHLLLPASSPAQGLASGGLVGRCGGDGGVEFQGSREWQLARAEGMSAGYISPASLP